MARAWWRSCVRIVILSNFRHRLGLVLNCIAHPYRSLMRFSDWLVFDGLKLGNGSKQQEIVVGSSKDLLENTVDAFDECFRGNLHGAWDTAAAHEGTVCMTDVLVHFKPDGEGAYQFGLREQGL